MIPLPHPESGEVPKAYAVLKPGMKEFDLAEFVAAKVSPHKKLRGGVEWVDEIPKSPAGRLLVRLNVAIRLLTLFRSISRQDLATHFGGQGKGTGKSSSGQALMGSFRDRMLTKRKRKRDPNRSFFFRLLSLRLT